MIYGGATWSELPLSTQWQMMLNGDQVAYSGIIKTVLDETLKIETQKDFT
jgi:hypothetical protein